MAIQGLDAQCWIAALCVRDDGERLALGDGDYIFKEDQLHFMADTMANDTIEIQGGDGVLLAGQVRRASSQSFDGYIGAFGCTKAHIETLRRAFISFFAKDHFYTVIYVFPDGSAIKRTRGYIVDAPEVKELYQLSPEYHIAINFEDVNYYAYAEDDDGNEIYTFTANFTKTSVEGAVWDTTGLVWDENGAEWVTSTGEGPTALITASSIVNVYPVWTVNGEAITPTLENLTTGVKLTYNGTVADGSTLVVDMSNQTANLDGTDVTALMDGEWVSLLPGQNEVKFTTSSSIYSAKLEWNEVVG